MAKQYVKGGAILINLKYTLVRIYNSQTVLLDSNALFSQHFCLPCFSQETPPRLHYKYSPTYLANSSQGAKSLA